MISQSFELVLKSCSVVSASFLLAFRIIRAFVVVLARCTIFFVVVFTYFYSFTRFASCLWLCLLIHSLVLHSRLIVFLRYRFSFDSFSCCKIVLRSCKLGMHSYSLVYNRGYVLVLQFFVHSCVQFTIAVFHRFVL